MALNFPARTPMFSRKIPGGIFLINNESLNTGNIYWVCSVNGTDSVGNGFSPDAPFATLAYAIAQCTASQGDRIYVMENHAEAVIAAGTITLNKAGVSIIGLGSGDDRPTFSWTTSTAATMLMSGAGTRISNCIFDLTGISALVSGIVVSAAGCVIGGPLPGQGNFFKLAKAGAGTAPLAAILTTAGANRLLISENSFIGPPLTPTTVSAGTTCITLVGGTGIQIANNTIHGWFTTTVGGIQGLTTLSDNLVIRSNRIANQTASSQKAIVLFTGSTGFITNNQLGILLNAVPVTADTMFIAGNIYVSQQGFQATAESTF